MTITIGLLGGVLLGLRLSYGVLFPTSFFVGLALFSLGGLTWATLGQFVLALTAIQIGYLCGAAARCVGSSQPTAGKLLRPIRRH
jgi:hypothetical protein